jgi:6-phosphogluconolactonase
MMPAPAQRDIRILADPAAITRRAADEFVKSAAQAVARKGVFNVAFAGGSTPKALYAMLADDPNYRSKVPWGKLRVFFGDERHTPPDSNESNFHMATESLFSKGVLRSEQITRIKGEYPDTEKAAAEYEQALREYFKLKEGEFPGFDLILLGMGEEGHTLSLFPGTKALQETRRIVVRNWVGKLYTERITLTATAANHANQIMFLITRADKALALKAVLEGPYEPEQLPAQFIQPLSGNALWLIDRDAAKMLTVGIRE